MVEHETDLYELWEIYKDGQDGEVFEVVNCIIPEKVGTQVKLLASEGMYKALVHPDRFNKIVQMYGCLGTAKYKKVLSYKEISVFEAMRILMKPHSNRSVYILKGLSYERLTKSDRLEEFDIYSIQSLIGEKYYIKESR